jgi:UDP-glucose 4-epimerase
MAKVNTVLVTGGTGFIGSHACVALQQAGFEVVVLDNLCNSARGVLGRIGAISGQVPDFVEADVRDRAALDQLLAKRPFLAVMHFAGLKAVGESVAQPQRYHDNNVNGSRVLLEAMEAAALRTMVFSSTATVYRSPLQSPITEDAELGAAQPYAQSKLDVERLLQARRQQDPRWSVACLRYFNPVGAHPSGLIGEDPRGVPNNLMPFIAQVAVGRRERLQVFGDDYPTPDGTGVRDYLHVMDLAEGHVAALRHLLALGGELTLNLGTGTGVSVLQLLRAFETASGRVVPFDVVARRAGDEAQYWADPRRAEQLLGWRTQRSLDDMCRDSWTWQSNNPGGYDD